MAYRIDLTTTGTPSTVTINDLGDKKFIHPITDEDLLDEFSIVDLAKSNDLSASVAAGEVTIMDDHNRTIHSVSDFIMYADERIAYGSWFLNGNNTRTSISSALTFVKMAGTTAGVSGHMFSTSANRLTYIGAKTKKFIVHYYAGYFEEASYGDDMGLTILKNGSEQIDEAFSACSVTNRTDNVRNAAGSGVVELETNDYVEIWIANWDDGSDIAVGYATCTVKEISKRATE